MSDEAKEERERYRERTVDNALQLTEAEGTWEAKVLAAELRRLRERDVWNTQAERDQLKPERAAVVRYLLANASAAWATPTRLADAIERGEHLKDATR